MIRPGTEVDYHHFANSRKNHGDHHGQSYFGGGGMDVFNLNDLFFNRVDKSESPGPGNGKPVWKLPVTVQVMVTPILIADPPAFADDPQETGQAHPDEVYPFFLIILLEFTD